MNAPSPAADHPAPRTRTSTRKLTWLVGALVLLVGLSLWLHLGSSGGRLKGPPAMSAEQILAAPDSQVISQVTTDLRWKLNDLDPSQFSRWRSLPAPARHVLALSFVERDDAPDCPPIFEGFAALLSSTAPNAPTLAEIAEAYTAIGATASAKVVTEAAQLAVSTKFTPIAIGTVPAPTDPFTALNKQLLSLSSSSGVIGLLRTYVRSNAKEIATAGFGGA